MGTQLKNAFLPAHIISVWINPNVSRGQGCIDCGIAVVAKEAGIGAGDGFIGGAATETMQIKFPPVCTGYTASHD
jgi:hypothetical protein